GTGKSVLVKCILGLLEVDAGSITARKTDLVTASAKEREAFLKTTGMLFQGGALFDSLPVWENVAFGLMQAFGVKRAEAKKKAIEKLKRVGLDENAGNLYPAELSGGMRKRVGLARAIAADPEIIFFDEPTTGLDPIMTDVINKLIVESVKRLGATALTITHDMGSVMKVADRVAMIHEGMIVWQGAKTELAETKNPYVRQFVEGSAEGPIKVGAWGAP
ncbi:MAG TPA: ATP-binding cassette domain-containing protein, partial [Sphingomonadales bacterium]|nr:ATP-binding cassette domain-containing protein [Sphingomonadales bacterium]